MYGYSWFSIIVLLAGSLIASYGFIVSKKPEAREMLDKLVPFQGFIGIILLIWGIIDLIRSVGDWGSILRWEPFLGIVIIAYVLICIVLGFMLGFGLLKKYVFSKNEAALEKSSDIMLKLSKVQNQIGLLGIVVVILMIVLRAMYF